MFIGCKDGTLLEVSCRTFRIDREMENDMPIQHITVLENNMLVLAHSVRSGYLEERSALQIVRPGEDYIYESMTVINLVDTGDINEILINPVEDNELIIACQRGLFIAQITIKLSGKEKQGLRKNFIRDYMKRIANFDKGKGDYEVTIELQEERYFIGERVSQVVNSNVNQLLVALWDKPGFLKIDRRRNEQKVTLI